MNTNIDMRTHLLPGVVLILFSAALLAGCSGGGDSGKHRRRARPAVPVAVQKVKPGKVTVYATYPGRVRGAREVKVLSRVEGVLLKRHYNEGEFVEKGELLLTIDPRTFKAVVQQRKAQLAKARAKLNQAQQAWQRVSNLYEVNAVSESKRDKALAQLKTARAAVQLAKANLKTAQIKLDYTTIEAPISGVTSLQEIDEGALVRPGMLLTTITQLDPVKVLFSVPAEDALMRKKALAAMVKEGKNVTREATLILPSGKVYPETGVVNFTQSTIDPSTGTVRLRAIFDNSEHRLVPGRFVRVRIRLETREHAIVIPNKALASGQETALVYIVTDDNKAKAVPVQLGPVVEGGRIIEKGLQPGDRVITIGLGRIRPGSSVKIVPATRLALGRHGGKHKPGGGKAAAAKKPQKSKQGHSGAHASKTTDKQAG